MSSHQQHSKPLATFGDALRAKGHDWRADMRANGVDRRRAEPDRGHVEQPGEQRTGQPGRRRTVTVPPGRPPVALVRPNIAPAPPPPAPSAAPPPPPPVAAAPAKAPAVTPPAEPRSAPTPPAAAPPKRPEIMGHGADGRVLYAPRFRRATGREWVRRKAADPALTVRAFAEEKGIKASVMSRWTQRADHEANAARDARAAERRHRPAAPPAGKSPGKVGKGAFVAKGKGSRPVAIVSVELGNAIAELETLTSRVAALKTELRTLLEA